MTLTQPRTEDDELQPARKRASARVEFRPTPDQKQLFERAAALQGRTLTEFLVASAEENARRVLRDHEVVELSEQARTDFMNALMNPPAPNAKLRQLAARYEQEVESR